ncbi:MAG TPA: glycerophosphodiester phosphodiesterase, partial [Pseudonocardia sp.]|nr:glycerophosphodiester phosphodiesterase [Pseudonocardia sp.]
MRTTRLATAALAVAVLVPLIATPPAVAHPRGGHRAEFDIQAHRGGLGLRSESTLSSFGNAL